jgi:hypothetical protein
MLVAISCGFLSFDHQAFTCGFCHHRFIGSSGNGDVHTMKRKLDPPVVKWVLALGRNILF